MIDASRIQEHMEVLGSDGGHIGTVDKVEGQRLKLTRSDPSAQGQHHYIHLDSVESADNGVIRLNRTAAEAKNEWGVERVGSR